MADITTRDELARLFKGTGAEIGVLRGDYSRVICQYADKLYCVDPYTGYSNHKQAELDEAQAQARKALRGYDVEFKVMPSMMAVNEFKKNSLDFVYIDGNHEWQHVTQDIYWWARKVRPGGIVAGHDYFISDWEKSVQHVVPALDGYARAYKIDFHVTREKMPSWWFVK